MKQKKQTKKMISRYTQWITTIVVLHGMLMVTLSYVLSWFGRDPIVDVSRTEITEIVAPVVLYLLTNMVANIFEKNKLSFSEPINNIKDQINEAVKPE